MTGVKKFFKKYIGDKAFYKMIFTVALPIVIQNVVSNFVSLLDNIMVGQLGQDEICGVAYANQLFSIYGMVVVAIVTGISIFTTQFHGKNDDEGIKKTFRFKLLVILSLTVLMIVVLLLFGEQLISLFIAKDSIEGDPELTLAYGKEYMMYLLPSYILYAFSQSYASTMKETENTVLPMVSSFIAIGANALLNYIFIFGKLGLPALGITGAAIATVISRVVEFAILAIATHSSKKLTYSKGLYRGFFHIDKLLTSKILKSVTPLVINNFLWSFGMTAAASCYSSVDLAAGAAYSISNTFISMFSVFYISLGSAVSIIIGKYLGMGDKTVVQDIATKMLAFSVFIGTVLGIILISLSGLFPKLYNISDMAKSIASSFLFITGALMPLYAYMKSATATVCSGGKTLAIMLFDGVFVVGVVYPLALILTRCTSLPIAVIYLIINGVEVLSKDIFSIVMLKKKTWINQVV